MATVYPAQIDNTASLPIVNNQTPLGPDYFNSLRSAIVNIEQVLGVNPAAGFGTIGGALITIQNIASSGGGGMQLGGDIGGSLTVPRIIGIQGLPISSASPNVGDALVWNGIVWAPAPSITVGGDLSGSSTSQIVIGIQGRSVSNVVPTDGQVLTWSASGTHWIPQTVSSGSNTLIGDVSGLTTSNIVNKINGAAVPASGSLLTGNILQVSGASSLSYGAINLANSNSVTGALPNANQAPQTVGGDISGTTAATIVIKINGATVPVSGATGNTLQVTGVNTLGYGAINLAGGSNFITGTLPTGNQAAQTMGGDISGTTASATVNKVDGVSYPTSPSTNTVPVVTSANTVTYQQIVDAQISNAAAISGSKINPVFGSQNISTTGTLSSGATTVTSFRDTTLSVGIGHLDGSGNLTSSAVDLGTADVSGTLPAIKQAVQTMGGDVTGNTAATIVGKIQGNTVTSGALTKGQFLVAGSTSNWAATTLSGDISESATTAGQLTTVGLRGKTLASSLASVGAAQDGYFLSWVNANSDWEAKIAPSGSFSASGDLSGSSSSQTVVGLDGYAFTSKVNPGQTYQLNGSNQLAPAGIRTTINAAAYGVLPSNPDNSAALAKAFAASDAISNAEVYIPPGTYNINYPIDRFNTTNLRGEQHGSSGNATVISLSIIGSGISHPPYNYTGNIVGPAFYQHSNNNLQPNYFTQGGFTFAQTNHVTINGNPVSINNYIDLSQNITGSINGWSQFTFEIFCKNVNTSAGNGMIAQTSGSMSSSSPFTKGFNLFLNSTGSGSYNVGATLNTTGSGQQSITSGSNHFDGASIHKIAVSYDGTKARMFCDGYYVGGVAMTGPISQGWYEDFYLFAANGPGQWPGNSLVLQSFDGYYASMRLSNTARFTNEATNYGVETSTLPVDGYTVLLMDFGPNTTSDIKVIGGCGTSYFGGACPGTYGVTNGSATVSTSIYHPKLSSRNFVIFQDQPHVTYQVIGQGNFSLTLDRPYNGTTNATASAISQAAFNLPYTTVFQTPANIFYTWRQMSNQGASCSISDITFSSFGEGIYVEASPNSQLHRVDVSGTVKGCTFTDNCYLIEIEQLNFSVSNALGLSCHIWGLGLLGATGLAKIYNTGTSIASGSIGWNYVAVNSSGGLYEKNYSVSQEHGQYYINQADCIALNNFPTDEGGYQDTACYFLNNCAEFQMIGGEAQNWSSGLGSVIGIDGSNDNIINNGGTIYIAGDVSGNGSAFFDYDGLIFMQFTVTNGSTAVTSSVDISTIIKPGNKLAFAGSFVFYIVAAISGTSITLQTPYTGTSSSTAIMARYPVSIIKTYSPPLIPVTIGTPDQSFGGSSPYLPWTDGYCPISITPWEQADSHIITYTSDADMIIQDIDAVYGNITILDGYGLTTGRNLLIPPLVGNVRTFLNSTSQIITIKQWNPGSLTSIGATSVAIVAGSKVTISRTPKAITGTITASAGSTALVGSGTSFTTDLFVNEIIQLSGLPNLRFVVNTITNNTHLTMKTAWPTTGSSTLSLLIGTWDTSTALSLDGYSISGKVNPGQTLALNTSNQLVPAGIQSVINVLAYGADPTATTFSDNAFAAVMALADAQNGRKIYVPPGLYKLAYPIDSTIALNMSGQAAGFVTTIDTQIQINYSGVIKAPYSYTGNIVAPTIYQHSGANIQPVYLQEGNFWMLNYTGANWLNLSHQITGAINGWPQFTFEFFVSHVTLPGSPGRPQSVIESSGSMSNTSTFTKAFNLSFVDQGSGAYSVLSSLTTSNNTSTSFNSGSNHFDGYSLHKIAMSYDGAKARLFCDGYYCGGAIMTGAIIQSWFEDFYLFANGSPGQWPDQGIIAYTYNGHYGSVRISNTARYTNEATNYGVETSELTTDGYTVLLFNFDPAYRSDIKIIAGCGTTLFGYGVPGTFGVTNGSTTVTTSLYHPTFVGRLIFGNQPGSVYSVASQGNFSLTLTTPFTGATATTSAIVKQNDNLVFATPANIFYTWQGLINQGAGVALSNMTVTGLSDSVLCEGSPTSSFTNLMLNSYQRGLTLRNNCYLNQLDAVSFQSGQFGATSHTWGVGMIGACGITHMKNSGTAGSGGSCYSNGWNVVVTNASGGKFERNYSLSKEHGGYYINQSSCFADNNFPTDETGYQDTAAYCLNEVSQFVMIGGEAQNFSSGKGSVILVDGSSENLNTNAGTIIVGGTIAGGGPTIFDYDGLTNFTFSVTNGSTAVTASGSMTGILSSGQRILFLNNVSSDTYTLVAVSGTSITLNRVYAGTTNGAVLVTYVPLALITTNYPSPAPILINEPDQSSGGITPILPWTDGYSSLLISQFEGASTNLNFTSDADMVLGVNDCTYGILNITDTGTVLTTGRNVLLQPVCGSTKTVINSTAQTITIKQRSPLTNTSIGTTSIVINSGSKAVLTRYFKTITGTVTVTDAQVGITGSSTTFTTDLYAGQIIIFATNPNTQYVIKSITSNTVLILATSYRGATTSGVTIGAGTWI